MRFALCLFPAYSRRGLPYQSIVFASCLVSAECFYFTAVVTNNHEQIRVGKFLNPSRPVGRAGCFLELELLPKEVSQAVAAKRQRYRVKREWIARTKTRQAD